MRTWHKVLAALGLSLLLIAGAVWTLRPGRLRARNVILIVIDSLRADHLHLYGHSSVTMPWTEGVALRGATFERCLTQAPRPVASLVTLLTSLHLTTHGVEDRGRRLSPGLATLPQVLRWAGYRTRALSSSPDTAGYPDLARGFDSFDTSAVGQDDEAAARQITEDAIAWLSKPEDPPFFLMLQYHTPHPGWRFRRGQTDYAEYTDRVYSEMPVEEMRRLAPSLDAEDLKTLRGYYDGELHLVDRQIGHLLSALKRLALYKDLLLVITSGQGLEIGEGGRFDLDAPMAEGVLHVPLVMAAQGVIPPGLRVPAVVGTVDVAPTILGLLGVPRMPDMQGVDLFSPGVAPAPRLSEDLGAGLQRSLQGERYRLVKRYGPPPVLALYDPRQDPAQQHDRGQALPAVLALMNSELEAMVSRLAQASPAPPDGRAPAAPADGGPPTPEAGAATPGAPGGAAP